MPNDPRIVPGTQPISQVDSALEAQPAASFDQHTTWHAEVTQPTGGGIAFTPAPFVSGETVTIAMEIYRHGSGWKVRAVGQGYDTGLAGLAANYGIDVEP
ncbi:TerD family protein [Streptomyces sp. B21-083]|uniref:TerD family protein n=1 Tax=Streptomyces sp. B21-083 TaxID=3039410 RepID=UPI002FEF00C9